MIRAPEEYYSGKNFKRKISVWHCLFKQGYLKLWGRRLDAFLSSSVFPCVFSCSHQRCFRRTVTGIVNEHSLIYFKKIAQNHPFHEDGILLR
jgi:hypothetical protein